MISARVVVRSIVAVLAVPRGPEMPAPYVHGYAVDPLEDVSELVAAGWSWASGGVVSTPRDADRFVRGYVTGATTDPARFGLLRRIFGLAVCAAMANP